MISLQMSEYRDLSLCFSLPSSVVILQLHFHSERRVVDELKNFPTVRNSSKWCPETGYTDKDDTEIYPYRAFGLGKRESFRITIKMLNQNIDYLCGRGFNGYSVTFHLPNELPPMWKKRHHVGAGQVGNFLVAANLITTSPALRHYSPALRQCYFTSERKLRFFRFYTQQNCEVECLANFTHSKCDCVHFAMPSKETSVFFHVLSIESSNFLNCRIQCDENLWNTKIQLFDACRK